MSNFIDDKMDKLNEAVTLLKCIKTGMDVDIKEGDINHVTMKGTLVSPEFIERVNQFLNKM